jgi:hypothetical protein
MTLSTQMSANSCIPTSVVTSDKPSVGGFLFFMAIKKDFPVEKLVVGNSKTTEQMVGKKYGRLLVLKYEGNKIYPKGFAAPMVTAKCDCGSIHLYIATKLRTGYSKSCGCFQAENTSILRTKHGQKSPKHGKRGTILYARWRSMFDRVRSDKRYANVIISDRWKGENGFVNFCSDMGNMPTPKHTVDRYPISNGNYGPDNCRWATMKEQGQNTRKNVKYIFKGEFICVSEIARRVGLAPRELSRRLRNLKLDLEAAINYIPRKTKRKYENTTTIIL